MRSVLICLAGVYLATACSIGQSSTFALTSASADPTYMCPSGAANAPYDLHASIAARNETSSTVKIKSMSADLTLQAVGGPWLEKVGDRYNAAAVTFTPESVHARSTAQITATIPSACTSAKYGTGAASWGDYNVTLHVLTSGGTYSIKAANLHRIVTG